MGSVTGATSDVGSGVIGRWRSAWNLEQESKALMPAAPSRVAHPVSTLTAEEIDAARRRVVYSEQQADTPQARAALANKRNVSEAWIRSFGSEAALAKAKKNARVFMALAKAERRLGPERAAEAADDIASAVYWRDVADLIVAVAPGR